MDYITHKSDIINTMAPAEKLALNTLNVFSGRKWSLARLVAIFPDRFVFTICPEKTTDERNKSWKRLIQYKDGRLEIKEDSVANELVGEIFEKTEEKVWNMAEKLGYEGEECYARDVARMLFGHISLLTHVGDDERHYHVLYESIDEDPQIRLATDDEKLYMGYYFVRQEERTLRLAEQFGEVLLLRQRMDEETGNSYFAKVKDAKGDIHFLDFCYLDKDKALIMESEDFKVLEHYEEEPELQYQREILQEWMQRYRDAAKHGLSFEDSNIATI